MKPHEFILVKTVMTAGDEAWIQNHSVKMRGKGSDTEVVLTIGEVQLATAQRMIKGWHLTRTITNPISGEKVVAPIAFKPEAIAELPRTLYKYILAKISEMNPDEEAEETSQDFTTAVVDSSEEDFQAERVLRLNR